MTYIDDDIRKAYNEVSQILKMIPKEELEKVPSKLINFFEMEKDKDYSKDITFDIPLNKQEILEDTINILAFLYLQYFCPSKADKQVLLSLFESNERLN